MKEVRARQDESAKSLATCCIAWSALRSRVEQPRVATDLCNTANVLVTALLVEAKILVETEADVVTVETVGSKTLLEKVLLESSGNGRLA